VWVYMELMEISLADLYRKISPTPFPEPILAQFSVSIFEGLKYLKTKLNVMHRDVKPSNSQSCSIVHSLAYFSQVGFSKATCCVPFTEFNFYTLCFGPFVLSHYSTRTAFRLPIFHTTICARFAWRSNSRNSSRRACLSILRACLSILRSTVQNG
jgi:serine/threonine protein kinase